MWMLIFLLAFILKAITIFSNPFAYVANSVDDTVSVIDTSTNTVSTTISVGTSPLGIAITPDGAFLYVTNLNSNTVSVIDTSTNTVSATVSVGTSPFWIAITRNGAFAYVANVNDNTVTVIDTSTNTVSTTISVGTSPAGIAITPDGAFAYVANSADTIVSVIDISTNMVSTTVSAGAGPFSIAITPLLFLNMTGHSKKNKFLTERDLFNRISWSLPEGIIPPKQYQIFRDSQWIATISGNKQFFEDHNLKRKTYSNLVVAEDAFGSVATGTITIQSK